jgi:ATP-dependent protease HslVU (ClpYQ) peptidase subunit
MTCCAAVRLEGSSDIFYCTDSAVGYGSGYRRKMQEPKLWKETSDVCAVLESGSDFAISRVYYLFHELVNKDVDNATPESLAACVRQVQKDVAGDDPITAIECELLFCSDERIAVVGGDGGIIDYTDFAVIGHGQPVCNPILEMAFDKLGFSRTEKVSREILTHAFDITAGLCDSVCAPFHMDVIGF